MQGRWAGLVVCLFILPIALGPWPKFESTPEPSPLEWGYTTQFWYLRAFLVVLALPALRGVMILRQPPAVPTLEIGQDAVRWSDGARKEITVPRASVKHTTCWPMLLRFESAFDEPLQEIVVAEFDRDAVKGALDRHGWLGEPDRTVEEAMKRAYPSSARKLGRWLGGGRRGRQRP